MKPFAISVKKCEKNLYLAEKQLRKKENVFSGLQEVHSGGFFVDKLAGLAFLMTNTPMFMGFYPTLPDRLMPSLPEVKDLARTQGGFGGCPLIGNGDRARFVIPLFGCKRRARIICNTIGAETTWLKKMLNRNGQNLIEYAIVVAVVASAMLAMSTYVFRSVQATQQIIQKGFTD